VFQPLVKFHFVDRYCSPRDGWTVFVDIDASEEGRTGGARKNAEASVRQQKMQCEADEARASLEALGVHVGDRRRQWQKALGPALALPPGDRDILAVHRERLLLWVAEVEGGGAGQPEQKVYQALGQIVVAVQECVIPRYQSLYSVVVGDAGLKDHLERAKMLARIGVSGLYLAESRKDDIWLFEADPPA
jgi:hypothetical protein